MQGVAISYGFFPIISPKSFDCAEYDNNIIKIILFIGRRLAELELYVLLSKLIPKFCLSTEMQELELYQTTILTTKNPVKIKMVKREQ